MVVVFGVVVVVVVEVVGGAVLVGGDVDVGVVLVAAGAVVLVAAGWGAVVVVDSPGPVGIVEAGSVVVPEYSGTMLRLSASAFTYALAASSDGSSTPARNGGTSGGMRSFVVRPVTSTTEGWNQSRPPGRPW